jgi:threonine synthase
MVEPTLIDEKNGIRYTLDEPRWCSDERNPLSVSELQGIGEEQIDKKERSIWRYRNAFPKNISTKVSLGEGCTPLINLKFGGYDALFKLEWFAPTGSFKDRGASLMMSLLKHQNINEVVEDSSGNGGAAIAAYGAAAGIKVNIVAPETTSVAKIAQIKSYGARIHLIPGTREDTENAALKMAESCFYASHNWHPFFLQGTKTLGYELWEDLNFEAPHNVIIPTGAGSNVLGCDIAFQELKDLKLISKLPRLFAAQPRNCSPIDAAFRAGVNDHVENTFSSTIAEGTAIKRPIRLNSVLTALRQSSGGTIALEENEIAQATLDLAAKGLYAEPTCATAAAAFCKLVSNGTIKPEEKTVIILTGSGLKVTDFFQKSLGIC